MDPQEIEKRFTKRVKDFVCFNTHLRIVNQIIYKEYVCPLLEGKSNSNWYKKASERLEKDHGIFVSPATLIAHLRDIKNGKRSPVAASDFTSGFSYDSLPSSRYEKDALHARLDTLIHTFILEDTHYVGLPANQIVATSQKYDNISACEKDFDMYKFMYHLKDLVIKNKNVDIFNNDILYYLEQTDKKFNVFEFDFMGIITPRLVNRIANCITRTSMDTSIVSIVSIGGRKITIKDYERMMPYSLIFQLRNKGFGLHCKSISGRYIDHKSPMRYELLVIKKEEK